MLKINLHAKISYSCYYEGLLKQLLQSQTPV